jgi:hypothetical protein
MLGFLLRRRRRRRKTEKIKRICAFTITSASTCFKKTAGLRGHAHAWSWFMAVDISSFLSALTQLQATTLTHLQLHNAIPTSLLALWGHGTQLCFKNKTTCTTHVGY